MNAASSSATQPAAAIRAGGLCKRFGDLVAVSDVTFEVPEGGRFGLLGPNGAGKSTLIRMLTTLTPPSSGTATVAGHDVLENPAGVRRGIGVIPQAFTSDPDLSAVENLNFYARLYGLSGPARRKIVAELLHAVDLYEWRDKLVATFSGGMRRRLEIGRSLLHRPKILFLDEPTLGLDPASRLAVWEMIRGLQSESPFTLFMTTHYMEEADQLCDQIAIIDHGKIIALDSPSRLKSRLGEEQFIEVQFSSSPDGWEAAVRGLPAVQSLEIAGETWRIQSPSCNETGVALLQAAQQRGIQIASFSIRGSTMEDVFVRYTGRDLRDSSETPAGRDVSHLYEPRR